MKKEKVEKEEDEKHTKEEADDDDQEIDQNEDDDDDDKENPEEMDIREMRHKLETLTWCSMNTFFELIMPQEFVASIGC